MIIICILHLALQKQLSLQEVDEPQAYPTTTSLPRQSSIGTSGITASASVRSKSAQSNHTPSPASTNGVSLEEVNNVKARSPSPTEGLRNPDL